MSNNRTMRDAIRDAILTPIPQNINIYEFEHDIHEYGIDSQHETNRLTKEMVKERERERKRFERARDTDTETSEY